MEPGNSDLGRSKDNISNFLIVIPTLNEERTIGILIDDLLNYVDSSQILVIDGNSDDETVSIVLSKNVGYMAQKSIGKGGAIRDVFQEYNPDEYEGIIFLDGDLTYHPKDIRKLVETYYRDNKNMVIGDRLRGYRSKKAISKFNLFGNWLFSIMIKALFGGPLSDTQTGMRLMNSSLILEIRDKLKAKSFDIESEIHILCLKSNKTMINVPITYTERPESSTTKLNPFSSGFRILKRILLCRFTRY